VFLPASRKLGKYENGSPNWLRNNKNGDRQGSPLDQEVNMKAVLYEGPRKMKIIDIPKPAAEAGQVVVKVTICGVCARAGLPSVSQHPEA
jgi:hypothetical protein